MYYEFCSLYTLPIENNIVSSLSQVFSVMYSISINGNLLLVECIIFLMDSNWSNIPMYRHADHVTLWPSKPRFGCIGKEMIGFIWRQGDEFQFLKELFIRFSSDMK